MTIPFEFRWLRPLGISVVLFLLFGVMNVFVGGMIPFLTRADQATYLLMSERTDSVLFGDTPAGLGKINETLGLFRYLLLLWLAGLFLGFGLFQLAVTWFALRQGQAWALWTLTVSDLVMLPYWFLILSTYIRGGVTPAIGDLPPLISYLVVIPIAALLGWLGLRGG